jgi:regulator of protease activity HflC (stomatin/prohibitin superfamily)
VNLQIQEITEDVSIKTKDNSFMLLPAKVQFCASNSPEGAVKAFYELENPQAQISSYILNSIRMTASGMDMEELYSARSEMENDVQERLTEQFAGFGYVIKNVLVDEPQPSSEVRSAFNRVIASKREKEAAQNVADAERIRLVGIASAEAESKKLQGEGIAQMRDALAKGLKESIELITSANVSTEQALALLMDTNRQDTLSSVAAKGNLVVMDLSKGSEQIGQYMAASKAVVGSDSSLAHQKT